MVITYYLYVCKDGSIQLTKDKDSRFDNRCDWVELKNKVEIPNHMFEKITTTVNINVSDKLKEKNESTSKVDIVANFGAADLRRNNEEKAVQNNPN